MTSTKFETKPLFTRQQLTALLLPYLKPTDHICDAGCGLGYLSLALSSHAAHITAAERDAAALSVLRQELDARGTYRYSAARSDTGATFSAKLNLIFRQCITSVDYAQNMIVVKTMPGLANGAASAIDKLNIPEMLGTLAGDDTCFVVLKDTQAAAELCAEIREQIEH